MSKDLGQLLTQAFNTKVSTTDAASSFNEKADKTDTELLTSLSRGRLANSTVGTNSFAFGKEVTASGAQSHAEGELTSATASNAHAEGYYTEATGLYSHAEGNFSRAQGERAHAEGYNTRAVSDDTHAEGVGTSSVTSYSVFNNSQLMERQTPDTSNGISQAEGRGSHIEGYQTKTGAAQSHAEGYLTIARGLTSHAEGKMTYVNSGEAGHAEGKYTCTSGAGGEHAEGVYTYAGGGGGGHAEGYNTISNCGGAGHAEGYFTEAYGAQAQHAEGSFTYSSGGSSEHAEGVGTSATGAGGSHAEGYGSGSSINLSTKTITRTGPSASGMGSHAEGYSDSSLQTQAIGMGAHAEGYGTRAGGSYSHAEGKGGSYINGNSTYYYGAWGEASHIEGTCTQTTRPSAHAEGESTSAFGVASHAEGGYTTASGDYSHSEGYNTKTVNAYTHAEGENTYAIAERSHTEGLYTTSLGGTAHVIGKYNVLDTAISISSWAPYSAYEVGDVVKRIFTDNNNNITSVFKYKCETANSGESSFNLNQWDTIDELDYAVIVGNGTADNARSNAYALDWDGNGHFKGDVYVGASADSTGGNKVITEAHPAANIPAAPSTDGTYTLQVVISSGEATYSWVAANT